MIAKNVTSEDLTKALRITNTLYKGNLRFTSEGLTSLNSKGTRIRFRLSVHSSKELGHRLGFHRKKDGNRRKLASACWHAHGHFFESLLFVNCRASIRSGTIVIDTNGGNWQDRNIGSTFDPLRFSQACEC